MIQLFVVLIYILLSASGLVFFKLGSRVSGMSLIMKKGTLEFSMSLVSLAGLCCYIFSFALYMWIITKHDLTRIYPITSGLIYILVFLGGIFILGENISAVKLVGSAAILFGVILMNL